MTVYELYEKLNAKIPSSLSCEWDNDGLMCCPDGSREVHRALVCLDVTSATVDAAIDGKYDVIVSHHPFIFKGLKSLDESDFIPRKAMALIREGISVMSFHTRLDAVSGGVNDSLCALLGIKNAEPFGEGIGRIGALDESTELVDFAKKIKSTLGAPAVSVADAKRVVSRVAVLGGSGKDEIFSALSAGADTFVSGELGHHALTDAADLGINLIEAGHFYTEDHVCHVLCEMLKDQGIDADYFNSNNVTVI